MKLVEKANKRATTVAMERKRSADRKRKKDFENRKNIYIKRIEDKIMKLAEDGQYEYFFDAVPYARKHLSYEPEMFVAIAKHFDKQEFHVSYDGKKQGDKRDWNKPQKIPTYYTDRDHSGLPYPYGGATSLMISWSF